MVRNNVNNLVPQEEAAQKTTGSASTTTDTNSEFVARDEARDQQTTDTNSEFEARRDEARDQQAIQEDINPDAARSTDSSDSTTVFTPSSTPIRQISILGERNSGTRWTFE